MKKLFFIFSIIFLLAASCNTNTQNPNTSSPQAVTQTPTPTPKNNEPLLLTHNSALGVSFQYNSKAVAITEVGNKIYIDSLADAAKGDHNGNYFEVFKKNSSQTLTNAIWEKVLKGVSKSECYVEEAKANANIFKNFQTAYVLPTTESPTTPGGYCESDYVSAVTPQWFLYDPKHPTIFLFWKGGAGIDTEAIVTSLQLN